MDRLVPDLIYLILDNLDCRTRWPWVCKSWYIYATSAKGYWLRRFQREFPKELTWFPHDYSAKGRESLHAFHHFLVGMRPMYIDSQRSLKQMYQEIRECESLLNSRSEIVHFYRSDDLWWSRVPQQIDINQDIVHVTRYQVDMEYNQGSLKILITDLEQGRVETTTCPDRGQIYSPPWRDGFDPYQHTSTYQLSLAEFRDWLDEKVKEGYLPLTYNYADHDFVRRHYNWFVDMSEK